MALLRFIVLLQYGNYELIWLTTKVEQFSHCFSTAEGNGLSRGAGVYIIHQGKKKYKETQIINAALWKKNMKFNVF